MFYRSAIIFMKLKCLPDWRWGLLISEPPGWQLQTRPWAAEPRKAGRSSRTTGLTDGAAEAVGVSRPQGWGLGSTQQSPVCSDCRPRARSVTRPAGLCCKLLFAFLIYFKQKSINSITICILWNVSWRGDWFCCSSGICPAPSDHLLCSVPWLVTCVSLQAVFSSQILK